MKSKGIFIIVLIILTLLTGAYFLTQDKAESNIDTEDSVVQRTNEASLADRYIPFSSGVLENSRNRRVLFFYANWCPTCRPVDAELMAREAELPEDVVIIRVNYDDSETDVEEKALAQKYEITYQHTFVLIDENGDEIRKWNGGGLGQILSNLK